MEKEEDRGRNDHQEAEASSVRVKQYWRVALEHYDGRTIAAKVS